jgi:hypothetical protein
MFVQILNMISYVISSCINFFLRFDSVIGFVDLLVGVFIASLATRMLLIPLIGGRGSDLVLGAIKKNKTKTKTKTNTTKKGS